MKKRYELLDHTADIGIKAYGSSPAEIFSNAAFAMFSIITDIKNVRPVGELRIALEHDELDGLLVNWLSQLLYVHDTSRVVLSEFRVKIRKRGRYKLDAVVRGETFDPKRHCSKILIKAVTYHMLEVNREKGYATVLFDI